AGEMAIAPQFDYAANFSEGLAAVQMDGKYGFISPSGAWQVEPEYSNVGQFSEGYAWVQVDNRRGYITIDGNLLQSP
ncbi:MAG: WG repeat-containing protein, partial [Leptolyngbyaceae bacterium]|nr:WG repeat-containing protein [Leptolyngbyaceae bacterium]